jgi:ABC-2 type transport system permease protein
MRRSLDSYLLLLRWHYLRMRQELVLFVVIQMLLGVGVVYGLAMLLPNIDPRSALFLSTGAPTFGLILLGLTVVPQEVSQAKLSGRAQYIASLPVPRLASLAADVSWWLMIQVPGMGLSLLAASLRFHVHLRTGITVVPAVLLVAFTGASVGHAMASALKPQVAQQVTTFVTMVVLLFSPINFPPNRMPFVLRTIHRVLPIQYMADVMRGSLTGTFVTTPAIAFAVVAGWCVAGLAVSYRVALRRP